MSAPKCMLKLRSRTNYELWNHGIQSTLNEEGLEAKVLTQDPPPDGSAGPRNQVVWARKLIHIYEILLDSLDNTVYQGLQAHSLLKPSTKPDVDPKELYESIMEYCRPSSARRVKLVQELWNARISDFATAEEYVAYVEFIEVCVIEDGHNSILTDGLFEAVRSTHPELTDRWSPLCAGGFEKGSESVLAFLPGK
ncbi:hypothetical protein CSAL01_08052 [Colletotrichum salicis]|uniref:Uncharacterized protein n=1 Tax=Colletotrichum salicis TaxID=1209931 RepID=A0A135SFP7_9PEZI|nr:hypothetical protein CSAL01_08052 [Colletotrichum salicis]